MSFEEELSRVLPPEIPHRSTLIEKSARHLQLIAAANEIMNLTRISSPHEASVKHILDSVVPWRFFEGARCVLDAGTGAGFPGIPLSIVLPEIRFLLTDSTQKKARFVESVSETLDLPNVEVASERAEFIALTRRPPIITARAVAPLDRLIPLFGKSLAAGSRLLLYKGPDVDAEFEAINGSRTMAEILLRYELPSGLGTRTFVSVSGAPRKQARSKPQ